MKDRLDNNGNGIILASGFHQTPPLDGFLGQRTGMSCSPVVNTLEYCQSLEEIEQTLGFLTFNPF